MRLGLAQLLPLLLLTPLCTPVAAQTSVSFSVRADRYGGNSSGLLNDGTPARLRPTTPELFAVHLTRQRGKVRFGVGIGRAGTPISAVVDGGIVVQASSSDHVTEFDLEIARRLAGRATGPRLWGYVTPAIAYWNLTGTEKWNVSGTLGLELETPVTGPLGAYSRAALGLQRSSIQPAELPESFTAKPLWRRSLGLGLRLRL